MDSDFIESSTIDTKNRSIRKRVSEGVLWPRRPKIHRWYIRIFPKDQFIQIPYNPINKKKDKKILENLWNYTIIWSTDCLFTHNPYEKLFNKIDA